VTEFCEECYEGYHKWGEPEDLGDNLWRVTCKRCGFTETEFLFVEYWERKSVTILGKKYRALKAWGNISLCSECRKPIFDVPLILWDAEDESKAVTFHLKCAEKIGLLAQMGTRL